MVPRYRRSLEQLEDGVRVPQDEQVEEQPTGAPHDVLDAEDFDRLQLLNNPSSAGRLHPRG